MLLMNNDRTCNVHYHYCHYRQEYFCNNCECDFVIAVSFHFSLFHFYHVQDMSGLKRKCIGGAEKLRIKANKKKEIEKLKGSL